MLTRLHRRAGRASVCALSMLAGVAMVSASACDKVPLLAPTGTVITLYATATTVPINGEVELIATAIENGVASTPTTGTGGTGTTTPTTGTTTTTSTTGAGTPVQNGTLISFTTTIGRIEPSEARTTNGQVKVKFIAGGQSGNATITAYSGGASAKIENLPVGSAAVDHVILTATPQTLSASGGSTEVAARVENATGLGVSGIPVNFTTDNGTLSASSTLTDSSGVARVTLSTPAKAVVTATVGTKTATVTVNLNQRTGITITGPTTSVSAGTPASFTVAVNTAANIRNVVLDFGDGESRSLGAISGSITRTHVYEEEGTFIVTATATDTSGFAESVSTDVFVVPQQPPSVLLSASDTTPTVNQIITFTATVSGNTSSIQSYVWDFGDGTAPQTTTSPTITHAYSSAGTKVIRVTANQASGPSGTTVATVEVTL
jgi:hypothetical protein